MARNTPPTLVSYTETASWATTGASKSTASVSWQTGDVLVVVAGTESGSNIGTPTATGLTFTSRAAVTSGSVCGTRAATAVAASSGSSAITCTNAGGASDHWGFGVWVWRGSDGFDAAAEQHTSTKTVSATHTDTHSATCWGVFDFAAAAITGISLSPTATNERQKALDNSGGLHYTRYVADLTDHAASGGQAYGISGGSGTGPFSIVVVAVLGTTGSTTDNAPQGLATASGITPAPAVSATPGPGAATAGGAAPASGTTGTQGVATATGTAPAPTTSATPAPGTATASGQAPASGTTVTQGTAAGTSVAPVPSTSVTAGVGAASVAGIAPSGAAVLGQGVAVAVGISPTDGTDETTDVLPQGTADATGSAPSASVTATSPAGAATSSSVAPSASVTTTLTRGTANTSATAPAATVTTTLTRGTASATPATPVPHVTASLSRGTVVAIGIAIPGAAVQLVDLDAPRTASFTTTGATTATFEIAAATAEPDRATTTATFARPAVSASFEQAESEIAL